MWSGDQPDAGCHQGERGFFPCRRHRRAPANRVEGYSWAKGGEQRRSDASASWRRWPERSPERHPETWTGTRPSLLLDEAGKPVGIYPVVGTRCSFFQNNTGAKGFQFGAKLHRLKVELQERNDTSRPAILKKRREELATETRSLNLNLTRVRKRTDILIPH